MNNGNALRNFGFLFFSLLLSALPTAAEAQPGSQVTTPLTPAPTANDALPINALPINALPINALPINALPMNALPMKTLWVSPHLDYASVITASNGRACDQGAAAIPGIEGCVSAGTVVLWINGKLFLDGPVSTCPEDTRPYPDSRVCVDIALALEFKAGKVQLGDPPFACAENHRRVGRSFQCRQAKEENHFTSQVSPALACANNFFRPPGQFFCWSLDLVFRVNSEQHFGLEIPKGACPQGMARYQKGGVCAPTASLVPCGIGEACKFSVNEFTLVTGGGCCGQHDTRVINLPFRREAKSSANFNNASQFDTPANITAVFTCDSPPPCESCEPADGEFVDCQVFPLLDEQALIQ